MTAAWRPSPTSDSASRAWLRALEMTSGIEGQPERTFPVVVEELGQTFGEAPALLSLQRDLSHAALAARANRYARWALQQEIGKGDAVCLMMANCPDYLAIWLGITRVGGVVALLNSNLVGEALAHCIEVARPAHLIVTPEFAEVVAAAPLTMRPRTWRHDDAFSQAIAVLDGTPLEDGETRTVTLSDPALLIYTSGTTGLPKAAHVSHLRVMMWTHWFAGMMGTRADDRMYNCLPMYHSVGGVVANGAVLLRGGSVVLREKFSARTFWTDIAETDCTIFQYIGELCRYLQKSGSAPQSHRLRLACGNGLSGDVWPAFQEQFRIPRILEFYAATEGNFSLYNAEGKPGAIGRIPAFLAHRFPVSLIKLDEAGRPVRGTDGLCIRVARGETGEAVGRIAAGAARFEGYTDSAASEGKIVRNVVKSGDAWVRSGDLMRQDAQGYFYFVDRIGDTFRWKGENVATSEVGAVLSGYPGVVEANVYGVAVPGMDGRAGMAALVVSPDFELSRLRVYLAERLPAYARPLFLRLVRSMARTDTFKPKKQELVRQGFDPSAVTEPLYCDLGGGYVPLDADVYTRISRGLARL